MNVCRRICIEKSSAFIFFSLSNSGKMYNSKGFQPSLTTLAPFFRLVIHDTNIRLLQKSLVHLIVQRFLP